MSWSISFIGKPENIVEALNAHSEKIDGQCKQEYDAALPNIIALVNLNHDNEYPFAIKVEGNGHAYTANQREYSSVNISITQLNGLLV